MTQRENPTMHRLNQYSNDLKKTIGLRYLFVAGINVAEGKNATQFTSLNYAGFDWTADKAVDGCVNQDDPDNQKCCSASQGVAASNFWRVDLGQAYTVSLIVVYGRFPGNVVFYLSLNVEI